MRFYFGIHFWLLLLPFCCCGFVAGPIPDGADAVIQVEDTEQIEDSSFESKRVRILVETIKGADIRPVVCLCYFLNVKLVKNVIKS